MLRRDVVSCIECSSQLRTLVSVSSCFPLFFFRLLCFFNTTLCFSPAFVLLRESITRCFSLSLLLLLSRCSLVSHPPSFPTSSRRKKLNEKKQTHEVLITGIASGLVEEKTYFFHDNFALVVQKRCSFSLLHSKLVSQFTVMFTRESGEKKN